MAITLNTNKFSATTVTRYPNTGIELKNAPRANIATARVRTAFNMPSFPTASQRARLSSAIFLSGMENTQPKTAKSTISNKAANGNTIITGSIASQDPSSNNVSNVFRRRVLSGSSSRTAATTWARNLQSPRVPPPQNKEAAIAANDKAVVEGAAPDCPCTATPTAFETALTSNPDVTADTDDVTALAVTGSQAIDIASGTPLTAADRTCICSGVRIE